MIAKCDWGRFKKRAAAYRKIHLEERAQQYARQNSLSVQQAISELIAHEEVQGTFQMLSRNLKNEGRSQLATLWEATNNNGDYSKDVARKKILT